MTATDKIFISHDSVNKLLFAKIPLAKTLIFFNALIFTKEQADKK